jgi:hypothetical protein
MSEYPEEFKHKMIEAAGNSPDMSAMVREFADLMDAGKVECLMTRHPNQPGDLRRRWTLHFRDFMPGHP